ncbi:uncharacterized protein LOC141629035 [Silene latifolia]|uniref:uncharacterized protein LOC141629035 n=1 Tax=Silene latifolia TaxID=37657 RepID=UPI003D77C994
MKEDVQNYITQFSTYKQCKYDPSAYPGSETSTELCKWLSAVEYWYNTSYHTSLKASPTEWYRSLVTREEASTAIRIHLSRAQNRMRQQANKQRSKREFQEGDFVYLKLQPYRQISIASRGNRKLSKRYYGPYQILKRIGPVAYKLSLPPSAKIHHTFHVSLLKKFYGDPPEIIDPTELQLQPRQPELIMARKIVKTGRINVTKVLVKWSDSQLEDATWEFLYDLKLKYPSFDPWGQGSFEG